MALDNVCNKKHFVLVHGACHGAWCWYKLKPLLEASGHRVTALDLAASGVNPKFIHEVTSMEEYSAPLLEFMASLPPEEKVILVGHSLGGLNLAFAMDRFPSKVSVAVFVSAFMPDTSHRPSYVLEEHGKTAPEGYWMDTKLLSCSISKDPLTTMSFGPEFMRSRLYQLSSAEDFALVMMLTRPGSLYMEDLSTVGILSNEGYGSIEKVYIVCTDDLGIPEDHQRWMIENSGVKVVMEIRDADHMAMLSKTQELYDCLMEISRKG